VLPEIARWPAAAAAYRARLIEAAGERRKEIVDRLDRVERRPLRGRTCEGGRIAFAFVDRTRVFVKVSTGGTAAGAYTAEPDICMAITLIGQSMALTREGVRLVGGPAMLARTRW
jgi:hypothetical protein